MVLHTLQTGPLWVNTYILRADGRTDCVVIDPGGAEPVADYLSSHALRCTHILLTHGHFDHILGVAALAQATGAKVCIHEADAPMLFDAKASLAGSRLQFTPVAADVLLRDGDVLDAAGLSIRVLHTPGHTMGGVCYVIEEENAVFCGDTIFCGSVGRTDFPHSSAAKLRASIRRLMLLDDGVALYPGHDEATTVGGERRSNPYCRS